MMIADLAILSPLVLGLYFAAYAMLHSLLASEQAKQAAQRRFPRSHRWYRLFYNIVAVTTSVPIIVLLSIEAS